MPPQLQKGKAESDLMGECKISNPLVSEEVNRGMTPEITIDSEELDFQKGKEEFEKKFILEALRRNKGRLNQTALQSNIPKKTLQRKIQKYGIDLSEFKK